jgi:hypothetical protein
VLENDAKTLIRRYFERHRHNGIRAEEIPLTIQRVTNLVMNELHWPALIKNDGIRVDVLSRYDRETQNDVVAQICDAINSQVSKASSPEIQA